MSQAPRGSKSAYPTPRNGKSTSNRADSFSPEHPTITSLEEKVVALKNLLKERTGQVAGTVQITEGSLQLGQLRQSQIADITRAQAERVGL